MLFSLVACNSDPQKKAEGTTAGDVTTEAPEDTEVSNEGTSSINKDVIYDYANIKYVGDGAEFYAGYSRKDITPTKFPITVDYGVQANGVKEGEELYTTCVALSDGNTKVLFISVDIVEINETIYSQFVEYIRKSVKIDEANIFITATHNHSSPQLRIFDMDLVRWKRQAAEATAEAAKEAIEDLTRTEAYIGTAHSQDLAFVRRYLLADGTYKGIISGNKSTAAIVAHESEADSELQAIYFAREGDKKSILMANWQAHAAHAYAEDSHTISSDFVGCMRADVERKYGVLFAYYQGAAGNINLYSSVKNLTGSRYVRVGRSLAVVCGKALSSLRRVELSEIKISNQIFEAEVRKDAKDGEKVAAAKKIEAGQDDGTLMKKYGFASSREVGTVVTASTYVTLYPDGVPLSISAVSLGDIGFVTAPYEMFDTNGMAIKKASEFDMTFVCAYTNGHFGYVASEEAFPHGEYEVYSTRLERGTAELVAAELVKMLNGLKEN